VGLVIVAIAGNAVENTVGLVLAWKGARIWRSRSSKTQWRRSRRSCSRCSCSSPCCCDTLTFALAPVYIGALALMALALRQVTGDGEAEAFEGWALAGLYVLVAVVAVFE
jgi:Ca2+:H+ antiporter